MKQIGVAFALLFSLQAYGDPAEGCAQAKPLSPTFEHRFSDILNANRPTQHECVLDDLPPADYFERKLRKMPSDKLDRAFDALVREDLLTMAGARGCKTSLCRAKKIWGSEEGIKLLFLQAEYGLNLSEIGSPTGEKPARFTLSEINGILVSAMQLPHQLFPISGNPNFTVVRLKRSENLTGAEGKAIKAAAATDGKTFLSVFGDSNSMHVYIHEMAHSFYVQKGPDFQNRWNKLSGWTLKKDAWSATPKANFVSDYAKDTNSWNAPNEDFAESLSSFRLSPKKLLACCKAKYDFIRDEIFGGKTFLTYGNCSGLTEKQTKSLTAKLNPVRVSLIQPPRYKLFDECAKKTWMYSRFSCTDDFIGENKKTDILPPDLIVERARKLGINMTETQAQYFTQEVRSGSNYNPELHKKVEDNVILKIRWAALKARSYTEKLPLVVREKNKIERSIGMNAKSSDKIAQIFSKNPTSTLYITTLYSIIAEVAGPIPTAGKPLEREEIAYFVQAAPEFEKLRIWAQEESVKFYDKIFQLKNPKLSGLNCDDYQGSDIPGFNHICVLMTQDHKRVDSAKIRTFLKDRFNGIPLKEPEQGALLVTDTPAGNP